MAGIGREISMHNINIRYPPYKSTIVINWQHSPVLGQHQVSKVRVILFWAAFNSGQWLFEI